MGKQIQGNVDFKVLVVAVVIFSVQFFEFFVIFVNFYDVIKILVGSISLNQISLVNVFSVAIIKIDIISLNLKIVWVDPWHFSACGLSSELFRMCKDTEI